MIYAITCSRCEKNYIGKTKRRLADRFTEHLRIKINFPGLPVAAHFNSSEHSMFSAMVSVVTSCVNDYISICTDAELFVSFCRISYIFILILYKFIYISTRVCII